MITISNAQSITGQLTSFTRPCSQDISIDAKGLTIFPGLIDPHVHFRTPGLEHKEDWQHAAKAALCGGYTTVFDMPNTLPPTMTRTSLYEKKQLIDEQLKAVGIPLRYQLYFGASKNHLSEIYHVKQDAIGLKVFMGCSTGQLVIDDDESLHAVFAIAATQNLLIAVHAEDEQRIQKRSALLSQTKRYSYHSLIRDVEVATRAVEKALKLAKIYKTRLYLLHISTAEEVHLIKQAKQEGLVVYAETTPHHLFLDDSHYALLNGQAVVNPPLRHKSHRPTLLAAVRDGIIDTIGSDHAPHTIEEKARVYGECPSGMPGIETTLPLLLNAYHQGYWTLERIIALTATRPRQIFNLPENQDFVLVDLEKKIEVNKAQLKTKCCWSAYDGSVLQGWPAYTIIHDQCFDLHPFHLLNEQEVI